MRATNGYTVVNSRVERAGKALNWSSNSMLHCTRPPGGGRRIPCCTARVLSPLVPCARDVEIAIPPLSCFLYSPRAHKGQVVTKCPAALCRAAGAPVRRGSGPCRASAGRTARFHGAGLGWARGPGQAPVRARQAAGRAMTYDGTFYLGARGDFGLQYSLGRGPALGRKTINL